MAAYNTIMSAGVSLRRAMLATGIGTDRIFPVATPVDTELPFVTFFRSGVDTTEIKDGRGPRSGFYQIQIYSETWTEGIEIAERIDAVLSGYADDKVRRCVLTDAMENHDPSVPAYMQILTYKVKI